MNIRFSKLLRAFTAACCLSPLFAAFTLAAPTAAAQAQSPQPLTLFNGTSLAGWKANGTWTFAGGVLASSGSQSRSLITLVPFSDFTLFFDYNESSLVNARLRVWAPHEEPGGSAIDLDFSGTPAGVGGVEGAPRSAIATVSAGWHHVQVESSHGQLTVRVDGASAGTAVSPGPRSGYLGWEASGEGTLQVRNVKMVLSGLTPAFNGTDLGAWKAVADAPKSKGGVTHDMAKTLTFGLGGGSTKPHNAKWTVQGGALHGEDGPGGLEYSTPIDDAIIEVSASIKGEPKPDHFTSINLRNAAGQMEGGYGVGIGPFSGSIENLVKHPPVGGGPQEETIIISGRTVEIWVAGNLVTVYTDPRPNAAKVAQGAKTAGGTATLVLQGGGVQLNVQRISITTLPKDSGAAPASLPVAVAATPNPTAPAAAPAASPAETALLVQQQSVQKQADSDRQTKQRVASLMALALSTTDPAKQMDLYNQVVQLDPANAPAVQGYKDAQTKLQTAQSTQDQQLAAEVNQQHSTLVSGQQVNDSLVKAQGAFLAGHLAEASTALSVAERLAPGNPMVRDLRARINATSSLHSRLLLLAGGAGLVTLLAGLALWLRRRRQQRFPMLEITRGLDAGQQFPIEKDTVRIGAVAQDGGQKNDVVVRDVDRLISRFHCEVVRKNGQLYLTDLKSSNGTKLEGVALEPGRPMLLRRGNHILLANVVELRFGFDRKERTRT